MHLTGRVNGGSVRADATVDGRSPCDRNATETGGATPRVAHRVRGPLVERVERIVASTLLDPWLSLRALAEYSGLSRRMLWTHVHDPVAPIPHFRVGEAGGKILVRRSEFDAWMERWRERPAIIYDRAVTMLSRQAPRGR